MNECCICYSVINEAPQSCGHYTHINCLKKHFKPECPLCRTVLNIEVNGSKPDSYIPFSVQEDKESSSDSDEEDSDNGDFEEKEELSSWKLDGYLYREEHPDYDEENPDDIDEGFENRFQNYDPTTNRYWSNYFY